MELEVENSTIYKYPHAFINKIGDPILVTTMDDKRCQRLLDMYLAYQPRNSFQGLPPIQDEACVNWVLCMVDNGINLVALSFGEGVVGHIVLFPINEVACEMLVVVCPQSQNRGIGTELVRCSIQLAHEIDFEKMRLSVQSTNVRARHVYKKCGFENTSDDRGGEINMAVDLKQYRDSVSVNVAQIMNANVIALHADESCRAALDIFLNKYVASLPVVDNQDELIGIITKSDLMVPSKINRSVRDVFTRDVLTVREECEIGKVIRMFQSKKVRAIPVVDRDMKLVGIVSRKDILAYYAKSL